MPPRQDTLLGLVLGVRPLFLFSSGIQAFSSGTLFMLEKKVLYLWHIRIYGFPSRCLAPPI